MDEEIFASLRPLRGLVATVVLGGSVQEEFASCREELRAWNIANGFTNVEYVNFHAQLVEHGRDAALRHALSPAGGPAYDWCLQVDADATFPPDALAKILHAAYVAAPDSDVVGAYAQLKGSYLPTIDTGSGTWEPHFPGSGILPVIRTGAHFILVKTPILGRFGPPWFRSRVSIRPIDALREVDNFSRIHHHGRNVLEGEAWDALLEEARTQAGGATSPVGEDSGFCDAVKAAGGAIYVDTDLVTGHIERRVITPTLLKEKLREREEKFKQAVGVLR